MSNTYLLGNAVRLSATFKDFSGNFADPTSVALTVKKSGGSAENPTPIKDSVGNYHYDYAAAEAGTYYYRFNGTGAIVAAVEGEFIISAPAA